MEEDDFFERYMRSEENQIQEILYEYKRLHLTMRCVGSSLKIPGFWTEGDDGDTTPYEVRLEELRWQLNALSAMRRTDAVEAANEAIIAKHQNTEK